MASRRALLHRSGSLVEPSSWLRWRPDAALLEQQIATIHQHQAGSTTALLTAMVLDPALQLSLSGPPQPERLEALTAFAAGLERLPNRPAVTLLAVSEFGRRLRENGSRGTDHGSASVVLLFGEQLSCRLIGRYPSLSALDDRGDLIPGLAPPELCRRVLEVVVGEGFRQLRWCGCARQSCSKSSSREI